LKTKNPVIILLAPFSSYDLEASLAWEFQRIFAADKQRRLLRLAVLLEIYRQSKGRYPADLAELGPNIDATSIIYERTAPDAYHLRHFGENGVDDGQTGLDLSGPDWSIR